MRSFESIRGTASSKTFKLLASTQQVPVPGEMLTWRELYQFRPRGGARKKTWSVGYTGPFHRIFVLGMDFLVRSFTRGLVEQLSQSEVLRKPLCELRF